jgi:hypothetical protein
VSPVVEAGKVTEYKVEISKPLWSRTVLLWVEKAFSPLLTLWISRRVGKMVCGAAWRALIGLLRAARTLEIMRKAIAEDFILIFRDECARAGCLILRNFGYVEFLLVR